MSANPDSSHRPATASTQAHDGAEQALNESHLEALAETASFALDQAKRAGATDADVMAARTVEFEVKVADGAIVTLTQATSRGLGLRVYVGQQMGFVTTSDLGRDALSTAVERAVAAAKISTPDPHHGLPDPSTTAGAMPGNERATAFAHSDEGLDLYDPAVAAVSTEEKIEWAHALERAARTADPRVVKFRDSGIATDTSEVILLNSRGVSVGRRSSGITAWCTPIAEADGELQTEVWYACKNHLADLPSIASIGHKAGERAARMLGAKPVPTQHCPVVFEPHMAAEFAANLLAALNGDMVYKKASFLADQLNAQIASPKVTIVDDPLKPRGLASTRFDGEGLPTQKRCIIDGGVLKSFLYDSYTARKAGVASTANARRGYSSLPGIGAYNFYVAPGTDNPDSIISSMERGLIVTRGLGSGLNPVSGEYSRGANGLWVEDGKVVHPVQEVTIAGDALDILKNVDAVADDLEMRATLGAPTVRVAQMTVSGK